MSKGTSTAVAVIGSNPLNGIEILKQELKNLKEIQNTPYKADVNMEPVSSNKISVETDVSKLIEFHAVTTARHNAFGDSQQILGVKEAPVFRMNGGTLGEITQSIKHRIQIIQTEDRRKELEELVKEGESLLTQEHKVQLYAEKVAKATGAKI